MRNKTYNEIIAYIRSFSNEHLDVKRFAEEDEDQMSSVTAMDEKFPMIFATPTGNEFDYEINGYTLRIYCYDRLMKDRSNSTNIRSKTNQILNDLDVWLRKESSLPFEIDEISNVTPFSSELMTDVTGWYIDLTIDVPSYSVCNIPFNTLPLIPSYDCDDNDGDYYLKCRDLIDCPTIIDIKQDITNVLETIDGIGSNFGNTYFVTSGGDDITGERGNINKPFRTISAARNRVVDDITNGDAVGETLIYVFPGTYIDEEEMQYENGNFYFTPGTSVIAKQRTWSPRTETALFILGKTPKHNTYYAENCNIYGQGKFYLGKSLDNDWNGYILYTEGSSNCYFECDLIDVDQGVGIHVQGNSVVNARGNTFNVRNGGYGATVREGSNTTFDFQTMYAYDTTFTVQTNFTGKCILNVNNISGRSNVIGISNMTPNSMVVINAPVIESVSGYGVDVKQNNAGDIYINGNIFGQNGIYTWFNRGPSTVTFNGNIMVRNLPVSLHHNSVNYINSNEHKVYINGDIKSINGVANAILLRRGRLRLNGSLYNKKPDGTGIAFNGISITDNGVLIIDTFKIVTDNLSVTSTVARDIKVIHSLASNKALNANITNILNTGSNIIIDNEIE